MSNQQVNNGISFGGLWVIIFAALQIIGIINVSWWLILWPIWIPIAIAVCLGLFFVFAYIWGR